MIGVDVAGELDSEIIYDERERDWLPHVAPQSWGELAVVVSCLGESLFQLLVRKKAGLRQTVHSSSDAAIHKSFFDKCVQFVRGFLFPVE